MKKTLSFILLFSIILSLPISIFSCSNDGEDDQTDTKTPEETEASPIMTLPDGTKALSSEGYRLDFKKNDTGFGIYIVDGNTDTVMYKNDLPAEITVRDAARGPGIYSEDGFSASYSEVTESEDGYTALATVKTERGSEFLFTDKYYVTETGVFALLRNVSVVTANEGDVGFRSTYSIGTVKETKSAKNHDFFIPSILYKDSGDMVSHAIGSNLAVEKMYVKETRTGLPLAMLRSKTENYSVALCHLEPEITVGDNLGGGNHGDVNGELQYGSVGYTIQGGLSVDFCYPSLECPTVYYTNLKTKGIFHPLTEDVKHTYKLSIIPEYRDTYAESMTETFKAAYMTESPAVTDKINIDDIYDYNIEVFTRTYREYGTGKVIAAGVPWSIDLARGYAVEYTFQMGFVGQQTSVGYNLLRAGYTDKNDEMISQGKAIIDFWTSNTIMKDAVPIVWWDPRNDPTAGHTRGYPSFLRCFVDGMEGILDAYKITLENGEENEDWYAALVKVGDFLAENQNDDGSFYRAYFTNGRVCTDTTDSRYQGTSKLNTPVAIRYLAKMYELTGDEKYKAAAVAAADYSYETLFIEHEKYVGGTPDNANTVDKEAAIYALYGFNAAYGLTGDEKYLRASEHAAASAMSWVYAYDFACPSTEDQKKINPFAEVGRTSGFSIIATGHSAADNYSASMYYEMFKLYVYTGDTFYLEAAKLLQQNTKLSTDYDGKMGWKYRAIGPEATNISDFNFGTVGVWLPWSGIVNIKPIGYMEDTFGNGDIGKVASDIETLRSQLGTYGVGGKTAQ